MLLSDEKGAAAMHIIPQFLDDYKKREASDIAEVGGLDGYIEDWLDREREQGGYIFNLREEHPEWFMRGGKKKRKKSRKRNKKNKKGGTRKKYKYYFNEYI